MYNIIKVINVVELIQNVKENTVFIKKCMSEVNLYL